MPAKKVPRPASSSRPSRGLRQLPSGSAMSAPAITYSRTAPGAPVSQLRPGANIPPNDSPNTQTMSPHATEASPASRDDRPRATAISQAPRPTWIHTEAAPAWTGWYDQAVPPQLTRCCTQAGELAAVGSMASEGRPAAILGCACKIPSRIQSVPNPMRSTQRPLASGAPARTRASGTPVSDPVAALATPASGRTPGAANGQVRAVAQTSHTNATRRSAIAP